MPENIAGPVIPPDLEVPMLRRQPAVFDVENFDGPTSQPEPAGRLFAAVSGIT